MNWDFVEKYMDRDVPWGPVGYVTYKRTYSRLTDTGKTEEWWQTIFRCCRALVEELDACFTQEEIETLYDACFNLKCCFSGRALWQLGTPTVRRVGADSLQNCWFVSVNEPVEPFTFAFNQLMLGGGVGFNIQRENVFSLPRVKYNPSIIRSQSFDCDFIVPDNREGWVELLRMILESFFFSGKDVYYCTNCIRGKGAKISSFGGIASGPEELVNGLKLIVNILSQRVNHKLTPLDVLDIFNIVESIVVAGNVRRSSGIALGDSNDQCFLNSKAWGRHFIPNWRAMSNNTVIANSIKELPDLYWSNFEDKINGEAISECLGLMNLYNAQHYGRLADGFDYRPDLNVQGMNPCGEVTLEPYEACNLFELFLPNLENEEEFKIVAGLGYKVGKSICQYPYSHPRTQEVVKRNQRIGLGVTGFLQAPHLRDNLIFNNVYRYLEALDAEYSKKIGANKSIKLTAIKPSGTLSLLAGVCSGGGAAYAEYCIRRIRFAANDPIIKTCYDNGYKVEPVLRLDGSQDFGTVCVEFPVHYANAVTAKNLPAIDQLEVQKWLQCNWADNSVSSTIHFRDSELPGIKAWLGKNYADYIKSISFNRHSNHGFTQAPFEEITHAQYDEMRQKCKPINFISDSQELTLADSVECQNGVCPVR